MLISAPLVLGCGRVGYELLEVTDGGADVIDADPSSAGDGGLFGIDATTATGGLGNALVTSNTATCPAGMEAVGATVQCANGRHLQDSHPVAGGWAASCNGGVTTINVQCAPTATTILQQTTPSFPTTEQVNSSCANDDQQIIGGGCDCANGDLRKSEPYPFISLPSLAYWDCRCGNSVGQDITAYAICVPKTQYESWGVIVEGSTIGSSDTHSHTCPAGTKVIGGGCISSAADPSLASPLHLSEPSGADAWLCQTEATTPTLRVKAICALP